VGSARGARHEVVHEDVDMSMEYIRRILGFTNRRREHENRQFDMRRGDEIAKKKYNYHPVNLPRDLADNIEEIIESNKHGYTSIPEFVRAAIRKYLRELGYIE
jgi:hypothetical protein